MVLRPLLVAAVLAALPAASARPPEGPATGSPGAVARTPPSSRPAIEAAFPRESYRPGEGIRFAISTPALGVRMQVFRAGAEMGRIVAPDELRGTAVGRLRRLGDVSAGRVVWLRIRSAWTSGLYFVRLRSADGKVGFAPFVVRPRRLGEHRVAVVLPTFTWQAYNFRDDDGDGDEDTWYADDDEHTVRLGRPYENRGVPPFYRHYDQPFLRWLYHTGRAVDYLSDSDLDALPDGRGLASAYDLLIFPGHHEYVTAREYDAVEQFRDLGGNLMFLSANNFYWRVDRRGSLIARIRHWRELGRPEASLVGVQYVGNDLGEHRRPWLVRDPVTIPWLFSGITSRRGYRLSSGGIEVDMIATSSPRGTRLVAEIPNLLGPGKSAQMTYYETPNGAKVFAAGAFTLAGSAWQPDVGRLLENLWARLARHR